MVVKKLMRQLLALFAGGRRQCPRKIIFKEFMLGETLIVPLVFVKYLKWKYQLSQCNGRWSDWKEQPISEQSDHGSCIV